jgi:lipopolysaccharide/colanic/teichoic acid biosynthesis glycosyltransferase
MGISLDSITKMDKGKITGIKSSLSQKDYFSAFLKRLMDILISTLGLLLLSPVFAVIALLIPRDSPGPVFFHGQRMGRSEKTFTIHKFRTMYENGISYNGPKVTANGDNRITPLGRWLRHTKINELPQLWNVFKGEMSMVGPRPEDPEYAMQWPEDVRQEVLSVRPGVTSPASIIYRDEEEILKTGSLMDDYLKRILPEKLRLDQLYVRNNTLLGDLDVLFMTMIMLLPRIRKSQVQESTLYSGPVYNFINRYFTWFVIDTLVAFIAISLSGVIWRLNAPLDLGIVRASGIAVFIAVLLGVTNFIFGLRHVTWRYASSVYVFDIALSTGFTTIILILINQYLFNPPLLPLSLIINFALLTFIGLVGVRYRERMLTGLANRWLSLRGSNTNIGERVLIVGAGDGGQLAVWLIHKSTFSGAFSIIGFVDDNYHKQHLRMVGYPVLGTTYDIPAIVEKHNIGIILFSIEKCTPADRERILSMCKKTATRLVIIPDLMKILERSMSRAAIEEPL